VNRWVLALIVGAAAAAAIGLMYLIRRRSKVDHFFVEIERGAGVFAVIGTAFAVILAFVVLEAFGSFNDARTGAEQEASLLVTMSRTAEFFPAEQRDVLDGILICYGRSVIDDEWPLLKEGKRSPVVQAWVVQFQGELKQLTVEDPKQEAAFLTLLDQADQRTDARRARLTEANRDLPAPIWFFLGIGAAMTIGFALFFADRREHFIVQGFLIGAVTVLVTSGLLLVWFLDNPYENRTGSIQPDEMERLLPIIESEHRNIALPCDAQGNPVARPA
jgi:hypothetical protein